MNIIPYYNFNYFYMNIGVSSTNMKHNENNFKLKERCTSYKRSIPNEANATTNKHSSLGILML